MKTSDFDYELPPGLIAQQPAEPRDAARLLVLRRAAGTIEHRAMRELPAFLDPGDLLVVNDTRVIPARLRGRRPVTGGAVEVFLLEERGDGAWEALLRAHRRPKPGDRIELAGGRAAAVFAEELGEGRALVRIESPVPVPQLLDEAGETPLPPYIRRAGAGPETAARDRERYQTIYARRPGAVAAPTAGLHFTPDLLARLEARGVRRAHLTLHVGLGTFRPVTVDDVEQHRMESERYEIPPETAEAIRAARAAGGRVVAVGSTVVRTLETAAAADGAVAAGAGRTNLFLRPPHRFRAVDAMLTNFHLPRSTLLMMVSALAGRELVFRAYAEAVREQYRFFSYGDGMLILP